MVGTPPFSFSAKNPCGLDFSLNLPGAYFHTGQYFPFISIRQLL